MPPSLRHLRVQECSRMFHGEKCLLSGIISHNDQLASGDRPKNGRKEEE
jgi:hypothetical protein